MNLKLKKNTTAILSILCISIIVGYLVSNLITANGMSFNKIIFIIGKDKHIHIHHFVLNIICILTLLIGRYVDWEVIVLLIGFNIGAILEDFSYIFKSGFKNPITDILKVHNHKIEYVSN
tara:strand:- start:270 stop:629 length:360 start_codon:yes stop_codon:yes gene_type:complete